MSLKTSNLVLASVIMIALSAPAFAQDTTGSDQTGQTTTNDTSTKDQPVSTAGQPRGAGEETQRDVNQQDRVENGLNSGQLSTGEAAHIEKGESKIDATEAKDMQNGSLSPQEKRRLQRMQNRESRQIYRDKHNNI